MSAKDKVLGTFELLEAIYLHTTTFEIQVATAVCSTFRNVMEHSEPLKNLVWNVRISMHLVPKKSIPGTWHFSLQEWTGIQDLNILGVPREGPETFMMAEKHQKYLEVLAGPKRQCALKLISDGSYKDIAVGSANQQGDFETAAYGTWRRNTVVEYLEHFHPSMKEGVMYYIGEDEGRQRLLDALKSATTL